MKDLFELNDPEAEQYLRKTRVFHFAKGLGDDHCFYTGVKLLFGRERRDGAIVWHRRQASVDHFFPAKFGGSRHHSNLILCSKFVNGCLGNLSPDDKMACREELLQIEARNDDEKMKLIKKYFADLRTSAPEKFEQVPVFGWNPKTEVIFMNGEPLKNPQSDMVIQSASPKAGEFGTIVNTYGALVCP